MFHKATLLKILGTSGGPVTSLRSTTFELAAPDASSGLVGERSIVISGISHPLQRPVENGLFLCAESEQSWRCE
jgi:hypothetical protein